MRKIAKSKKVHIGPKSMQHYANKHELEIVRIRYKSNGKFCGYGWDLIKPDTRDIVLSLEPYRKNGFTWIVSAAHLFYKGPKFIKRLGSYVFRDIDLAEKSGFILKNI